MIDKGDNASARSIVHGADARAARDGNIIEMNVGYRQCSRGLKREYIDCVKLVYDLCKGCVKTTMDDGRRTTTADDS
jgi:hypothetical protein